MAAWWPPEAASVRTELGKTPCSQRHKKGATIKQAANKQVEFVPYATTDLILAKTSVTDQHWSVRQHKADIQER